MTPDSHVQETKRLCVNYRELNAQLPKVVLGGKSSGAVTLVYIHMIYEMLAYLHDSKFFMSLDLINRYYHIKLSPTTRYKNAFTIIFVKYKSLRISFGLAQGPVYFAALVQNIFGKYNDFCFFHMDDVLVQTLVRATT